MLLLQKVDYGIRVQAGLAENRTLELDYGPRNTKYQGKST